MRDSRDAENFLLGACTKCWHRDLAAPKTVSMGLEMVEMILAVEETFGVHLVDDGLDEVKTPADLIDRVYTRLTERGEPGRCRTQVQFYKLRRALRQTCGVEASAVSLDVPMARLVPETGRRQLWESLREQLGVLAWRWPSLSRPKWMARILTVLTFAIFAGIACAVMQTSLGPFPGVVLGMAAAFAFVSLASKASASFQTILPPQLTVRALVQLSTPAGDPPLWTREDVALKVKDIVLEFVDAENYGPDKRFVEDMGMG